MRGVIVSIIVCVLVGALLYGWYVEEQQQKYEQRQNATISNIIDNNSVSVSFELEQPPEANITKAPINQTAESFLSKDSFIFLTGFGIVVIFFIFAIFGLYEMNKKKDFGS